MNKEEKRAVEKFRKLGIKKFREEKVTDEDLLSYFEFVIILNLIEGLQIENEELKKEIERQKGINTVINEKGLDKNYEKALEKTMTKFLKNNIANDFISKQKVKDKIEKLNDDFHAEELEDIMIGENYTITELVQYVLQELIEEREEK